MNKNNIAVSAEMLCLLRCPICKTRFTDCIKYITCERNHGFDFSNSGYLNLLRRSKNAIYDKSLFNARKQIIKNGFFEGRSEEHTSELQSREKLVCRLLLEKKI